jgi:hypothetical protein
VLPLAAGLVVLARAAWSQAPLPDLRAFIDQPLVPIEIQRNTTVPASDVAEGCAGGTTGRTLVRFTLSTVNEGTADVVLGDPGCPTCDVDPPPACTNPLFECSVADGHHHAHFSRYALYELLPRADAPAAAVGHKQGFCIEDTLCPLRTYNCAFQGLTAGCKDAYFNFLGCQYVDATDVPGGRYLLRASVNFERIIAESNYDNNTDAVPVELCDDIRAPTVRLRRRVTRPGHWSVAGRVLFAKPPLVKADPLADGALLRLALDGASLLEAAVPGGAHGTGCAAGDGWEVSQRGGRWVYSNASGFLDAACTVPAAGLRRLVLRRIKSGFNFAARGVLPATVAAPPTSAVTTVVMGQVTGPCGTDQLPTCSARRGGGITVCTGSPSGAFVDPS